MSKLQGDNLNSRCCINLRMDAVRLQHETSGEGERERQKKDERLERVVTWQESSPS
jgi:hypothetical protein